MCQSLQSRADQLGCFFGTLLSSSWIAPVVEDNQGPGDGVRSSVTLEQANWTACETNRGEKSQKVPCDCLELSSGASRAGKDGNRDRLGGFYSMGPFSFTFNASVSCSPSN